MIADVEELTYFENYDLENSITPVKQHELQHLLVETGYDPCKTDEIVNGFSYGFELGYEGSKQVRMRSKNLRFKGMCNNVILWNWVMKEVKLKWYVGLFKVIPFDYYIQSPIKLVPKDVVKT